MPKEIVVLRYGHRMIRDERVTSHCCLVARAFGAKKIIIAGEKDRDVEKSVRDVSERWGGKFEVEFTNSWTKSLAALKNNGFKAVHLTMYGIPITKAEGQLKKTGKIAFIIGSKKVERSVFEKSDYNVSITSQPHSEVAALAVALDRVFAGKELEKIFKGTKIAIIPSKKGKIVKTRQ